MKDFVKYTLATLFGLFLAGTAFLILGILSIAGILATENTSPAIPSHSILRLTLNGELQEDVPEDPLSELFGSSYTELSLKNILTAIQKAKEHPDIEGIYIEAQDLFGVTPAMAREIRETLKDIKTSGKFIIAYGDNYTQSCYYICIVADRLILNPQGQVNWCGMASQPIFYKDLLEKLGVRMQIFKVGSYKSAVEPFNSTRMSEANREQVSSYLNDIWQTMLYDVSEARALSVDRLNAYADSLTTFRPAEELVRNGMAKVVMTGDDKEHFDADVRSHPHFVCRRCGKVIDVETVGETKLAAAGHEVTGCDTTFFGVCAECLKKGGNHHG